MMNTSTQDLRQFVAWARREAVESTDADDKAFMTEQADITVREIERRGIAAYHAALFAELDAQPTVR